MLFTGKFFVIVASLFFFCCQSKKEDPKLLLNVPMRDSLLAKYGNNIAILSCLRCGCFVQYFNDFNGKTEGYVLLADTNCNKLNIPVHYISNDQVEQLSEDIYNLTLIKSEKGEIKSKIVKAGDSKQIAKDIRSFFK